MNVTGLVEAIAQRTADLLADRLDTAVSPEPWIDAAAAAEHICAPKSRLYDLVAAGELTPGRDGRRIAFQRSDLDRYMRRQVQP